MGGGSAGGHLAAATATLPGLDDPADDLRVSPLPDALLALLQSRQVTWALVATGQAEASLLDRAGWRSIHRDSVATVLAAPGP